jgi:hypothetical protein
MLSTSFGFYVNMYLNILNYIKLVYVFTID